MRTPRKTGFTLLESALVLGLTGIVATVVMSSMISAKDTTQEVGVEHDLLATGERGLAVLERELRNTSVDQAAELSVSSDGYTLRLRACTGFDPSTGAPTYGPRVTYSFFSLPSSRLGIPGESQLCRSEDGSPWSSVIVTGFTLPDFELKDGVVTVTFTVAKSVLISTTGKRDVRKRTVSRQYTIAGRPSARATASGTGGTNGSTGGTAGSTGGTTATGTKPPKAPPPPKSPPPPKGK
jgi:type II secretory pathway pseudopilin PulG